MLSSWRIPSSPSMTMWSSFSRKGGGGVAVKVNHYYCVDEKMYISKNPNGLSLSLSLSLCNKFPQHFFYSFFFSPFFSPPLLLFVIFSSHFFPFFPFSIPNKEKMHHHHFIIIIIMVAVEPLEEPTKEEALRKETTTPILRGGGGVAAAYDPPEWSGPPSSAFTVEVVKSGVVLETIALGPPRTHVTFGRHPECDVVIDHPSSSRLHCVVQFKKTRTTCSRSIQGRRTGRS